MRHDARTAEWFSASIQPGMSLNEFLEAHPDAKKLPNEDGGERYLVFATHACFICYSGRGFKDSQDVFGAVVTMADGVVGDVQPTRETDDQ